MKVFKKPEQDLSIEEVTEWLREMREQAFIPSSGFAVSAVFKVEANGETYYFAGPNAENTEHRLGTHGEEGAIAAMVTSLGKSAEITEGWVMAAPEGIKLHEPGSDLLCPCCGNCRQRISGFADPSVEISSISLNGEVETMDVATLLPGMFSFRDLEGTVADSSGVGQNTQALTAEEVENRLMRKDVELSDGEILEWLKDLESVDYASHTHNSVVIKLDDGTYVAGVKVEDAAYTGTNAVQSASAIMNAELGVQTVTEVWSYSKSGEAAKFPKPDEAFQPLTLSAVQTLGQYAASGNIEIHLFNEQGETKDIKLRQAAQYIPTIENPQPEIGAERLIG